jgi:hypothetical protein
VLGGPIRPPQAGAVGELITGGTFIAFYKITEDAQRAQPEIARNAARLRGLLVRRQNVTILYLPAPVMPPRTTRQKIEACAF